VKCFYSCRLVVNMLWVEYFDDQIHLYIVLLYDCISNNSPLNVYNYVPQGACLGNNTFCLDI
jgi:hypothetical protein